MFDFWKRKMPRFEPRSLNEAMESRDGIRPTASRQRKFEERLMPSGHVTVIKNYDRVQVKSMPARTSLIW